MKKFLKHKIVSAAFGVSFAFVSGGTLWSYFALKDISQPLIIHYSLGQINQVGTIWDLVGVGIAGLVAVGMNFMIALSLEEKDWFWGKFVAAATLVFSTLLFIGFAAIISVN